MQVVCFDVDGTLVQSAGFDGELYEEVIRDVLGVELHADLSRYKDVSDSGIIAEILEDFPATKRNRLAQEVRLDFIERTKRYVSENPQLIREVPGAVTLVEALRESPRVGICIATGGWAETAELKLQSIGLELSGLAMATSSDAIKRIEIMRLAESRVTQGPVTRRTYFDDGIWDQRAAAELGYDFVAIGGGVSHHVAFPDLSDIESILGQLGV